MSGPLEETPTSTRGRLISAAARLFQERGYHATSVSDVLGASGVPKGSLYHHFPAGKSDLADAVAAAISDVMLSIIQAAYDPAEHAESGNARLFEKFARLFERHAHWRVCPIQSFLIDNVLSGGRAQTGALLNSWIAATAKQLERLRGDPTQAEELWIALIGAWTLAGARDDATPLRTLGMRYGRGAIAVEQKS
ncbi:MAG: TetR/AcrR family transcriptional regulator [Pseudomonadota bacterium]